MKFKLLLSIFNIVLILSILTLFFIPMMFFDQIMLEDTKTVSYTGAGVLFFMFVIMNGFFLMRRKQVLLSEQQRWKELFEYLEAKLKKARIVSVYDINLFCECSLLVSGLERAGEMDTFLFDKHPSKAGQCSVPFAVIALLRGKIDHARAVAADLCSPRDKKQGTAVWYAGFTSYLLKDFSAAGTYFIQYLKGRRRHDVLIGCTVYLLESLLFAAEQPLKTDDAVKLTAAAKHKITSSYKKEQWLELTEAYKNDMAGFVLTALYQPSSEYLFTE